MNMLLDFPTLSKGITMGMDATITVTRTVSPTLWGQDENGLTREDNPQYKELVKLLGVADIAFPDETISFEVPVAYFRKDYDLHGFFMHISEYKNADDNYGSCELYREHIEAALEFVNSDAYNGGRFKKENAIYGLRHALRSKDDWFHYSAG
jgi:hypothetical protein